MRLRRRLARGAGLSFAFLITLAATRREAVPARRVRNARPSALSGLLWNWDEIAI